MIGVIAVIKLLKTSFYGLRYLRSLTQPCVLAILWYPVLDVYDIRRQSRDVDESSIYPTQPLEQDALASPGEILALY